jgi:AraC-like DNA-binding protein
MGVQPRVSAVAASGVVGLIGRYGGDPDRVIGAARLEMRDVGNPDASLDLNRYCDMFEQAARQTGVDDFGLRFGTAYRLENMGPLAELALNAPTLGEALRKLCRYFPAIQEHSTLALRDDGDLVRLEYQIRDGRILRRRQDAELSIGIFNAFFIRCFGPGWSPAEIHFEHLRAAEAGTHQTLLNAPVYFGQPANAILLRRALLKRAMPQARPERAAALEALLSHLAAQARPDDFVGRVVQEIRAGLPVRAADIDSVSARLSMSRAKLYRRLNAQGADFTRLTENVRRDLALSNVTQPHIPFTEIASLLGYSELSAFSRAFKRWTSQSPADFRKTAISIKSSPGMLHIHS